MTSEPTRPSADVVYLLATIAGFLGCIASAVIAFEHLPRETDVVPSGLAGFALVLAVAGWIHERDWRWRTFEALAVALGALAIGPLFLWATAIGWVVAVAALVAVVMFFFS